MLLGILSSDHGADDNHRRYLRTENWPAADLIANIGTEWRLKGLREAS